MQITLLDAEQRVALAGSSLNTSSAAPATWPDSMRRLQVLLDHQAAARAIDDAHALLGLGQRLGIDDVAGRLGQRRMQRDEIGARQQFVQFDLLHTELLGPFLRQERIVGDTLIFRPMRAVGDDRADIAAADDAQGLAGQLDAHELAIFPICRHGSRHWPGECRGPARTSWRWRARRW